MHLEIEEFSNFIDFLKTEQILNSEEINDALLFLDGIEGVISEGTFILGYQGLARFISKKLSINELESFIKNYVDILTQDADARYFFAQSLIEKPTLKQEERRMLINLMPSNYQPFLFRRFFGQNI